MTQIFNQTSQREIRRRLRQRSTRTEQILWKCVRSGQLGIRIKRQVGIGKYIADFYAPQIRLVIELDGGSHFEPRASANDLKRQKDIESLGITVLRFTDTEILGNIDQVIQRIQEEIERRSILDI